MIKKLFIMSFVLVSVTAGALYATETGGPDRGGEVGNGGQNQKTPVIALRAGGEVGNGHVCAIVRPIQCPAPKPSK